MVMKTDTYTKAILTIIAIVLVGIFFQNTNWIRPVQASSGTIDVNIESVGGYSTYGTVPVSISDEIEVNCTNCD